MSSNQILFGLGLVLVLAVGSQLLARVLERSRACRVVAGGLHRWYRDRRRASRQPVGLALPAVRLDRRRRDPVRCRAEAVVRGGPSGRPKGSRASCRSEVRSLPGSRVTATVALLYDGMDLGAAFLDRRDPRRLGPDRRAAAAGLHPPDRASPFPPEVGGDAHRPDRRAPRRRSSSSAVRSGKGWQPGTMLLDLAVGALVAAVAAPALRLLLREVHRTAPRLVVPATLMVVVAVVVAADLIREDAGLLAAVADRHRRGQSTEHRRQPLAVRVRGDARPAARSACCLCSSPHPSRPAKYGR